jgi:hypothetical protein
VSPKALLIGLIVVAVLVLGGGAFVLTSGSDDDESGQGDTTTTSSEVAGGGDDSEGSADTGDGGSAPSHDFDSPQQVVEAYIAATEGDCETIIALSSETMLQGVSPDMAIEECQAAFESAPEGESPFAGLEILHIDEEGDVATASCTNRAIEGLMVTITLVHDGEVWLVDNVA